MISGGTTPRNNIGRLLTTGWVDATFDPGADRVVRAVVVQADGKILVGGGFRRLGGGGTGVTPRNHIGRLNADGSLDLSFDPGASGQVWSLAVQADGHDIQTVEALGTPDNLHPLQQAFHEAHGLQCGFCTPGFLMTLLPFLAENPNPTEDEVRVAISGNLCRCTGYQHIVDAVLIAARQGREES